MLVPTSHVACVGAGTIGGGWTAHFLARGLQVKAYDPSPTALERLLRQVEVAWPNLERLGIAARAGLNNLQLHDSIDEVLSDAMFVQESAPEILNLKRAVLSEIDRLVDPSVIIGSSTSGLLLTDMTTNCLHPERIVIGHPFNPPYLVPLVEVVGGEQTSPQALEQARSFYEAMNKTVIVLDKEIPGFVANRLQEALWREALHMVKAGEATAEQIDLAIEHGPGIRWATMGPFQIAHLAGGPDGIAGSMRRFGSELKDPWTRMSAPAYSEDLIHQIAERAVLSEIDRLVDPSVIIGSSTSGLLL